jgi:hypothetical protein
MPRKSVAPQKSQPKPQKQPKPRRVILELEVETTAPIRELRRKGALRVELVGEGSPPPIEIIQAQANLIYTA